MKKFKYFLIPLIVIIIFSFILNKSLDNKYEKLKNIKDISSVRHTYNNIVRDRGGILKNQMASEDDLMLLGSSELGTKIDQNPINIFPFKDAQYEVSVFGRAHTQTLQHSAMLSSTNTLSEDSKIALILSAQWFDSLRGEEFVVNFSELQFYKFFENDKLSDKNKEYFAKRVEALLKQSGEYSEEAIFASLYTKDDILSKSVLAVLKPYYKLKEFMLETKDKMQTIKTLESLNDKDNNDNLKEINWEKEYEKAIEQGEAKVKNNDLNIDEEYYNTYIKDIYDSLKDTWKEKDLLNSNELEDFKFFLNVSKEMGVKPLIVLMPVNGIYYDHLGWTVEKRTEFYETIEAIAKEQGFDVLNLQDKEYEKYYMIDVMHLGWKGWLNIDEEMYKYFDER